MSKIRKQAKPDPSLGVDEHGHHILTSESLSRPHTKINKKLEKLVIASHNPGKIKEIKELLAPHKVVAHSARFLGLESPEETGDSFVDNALIKARMAVDATHLPVLADDSGLCVAALDGRPGVHTADWAIRHPYEGGSEGRDWYIAMGKVEGLLAAQTGKDAKKRTKEECSAYFICVLALVWPDGDSAIFEGRVQGSLTWPPRGKNGFGFDPIFVPDGHKKTFGEMEPEQKREISHRGEAFAKLVARCF